MKDYDAYLFDWDGTLGKTLEMWLDVYREQFSRFGANNLNDEQLAAGFGRLQQAALEAGIATENITELEAAMKQSSHDKSLAIELYPDAAELLAQLKNAGKKLALITTNWPAAVAVMLKKHGLEACFDCIVTADDVTSHKPSPEGIEYTLAHLGIGTSKALMLGDSDKDLGAANNAGIDSLLFYPPSHQLFYRLPELMQHQPTYTIASWHELLN